MSSITNICSFDTSINLRMPTQAEFKIEQGKCILKREQERLSSIQLVALIHWDAYCQLQKMKLFHLTSEVQGIFQSDEVSSEMASNRPSETSSGRIQFQPQPVQIQLLLQPEHLSDLTAYRGEQTITAPQVVTQILSELSHQEPAHSLLQTETWYLQTVSQTQTNGNVGSRNTDSHSVYYRTMWDYLEPDALRSDFKPDAHFFETLNQFMQSASAIQNDVDLSSESANSSLNIDQSSGEPLNVDVLTRVSQLCQSFVSLSAAPHVTDEGVIDHLMMGITALVKGSLGIPTVLPAVYTESDTLLESHSLFKLVIAFFVQEQWPFEHNQANQVLRMTYEGSHSTWQCFAHTEEDTRSFIFYSVASFKVPEEKRVEIAEYICRANYGLVLGNLEMDFQDGEVRYKTSIDVENSLLNFDLIKNVVDGNIYTFERYLPGFTALLTAQLTPEQAITQVEAS